MSANDDPRGHGAIDGSQVGGKEVKLLVRCAEGPTIEAR
jgi:hypothetical protein